MERVEFCKMLEDAKHVSGLNTVDIVKGLGMYPHRVRSLERGLNSAKMSKCLEYISLVKHVMVIDSNGESTHILDYASLMGWMFQAMGGGTRYSMAKNHKDVGYSQSYLSLLNKPEHSVTIDKFLALVNKLGCEVRLVKAEG